MGNLGRRKGGFIVDVEREGRKKEGEDRRRKRG